MTSIQLFKPLLKKRNNSITQICKSVNSFSNNFLKNMNTFLRSGYTILFIKKSIRMRCMRCTFAHTRPLCGFSVCFGHKSAAQDDRRTRRFTRSHGARQKVGVFHVSLLSDNFYGGDALTKRKGVSACFKNALRKGNPLQGILNGKEAIIRRPLLSSPQ